MVNIELKVNLNMNKLNIFVRYSNNSHSKSIISCHDAIDVTQSRLYVRTPGAKEMRCEENKTRTIRLNRSSLLF